MNKRQKQLAQIHIAKRELGLDEDTYRDLLESETGRRSAADMDEAELEAVIIRMKNCGWQAYPRRPKNMEVPGKARLKKTEALLADMMLPWAYADTIAQRKFGVRLCQWCTSEQMGGIIKELDTFLRLFSNILIYKYLITS
ncbi:MAG: regulatory protein GemA [Desulfobacteraceae bacterium]|nr:regulatory protein GemA [Desulfobacteraceae bacterium]